MVLHRVSYDSQDQWIRGRIQTQTGESVSFVSKNVITNRIAYIWVIKFWASSKRPMAVITFYVQSMSLRVVHSIHLWCVYIRSSWTWMSGSSSFSDANLYPFEDSESSKPCTQVVLWSGTTVSRTRISWRISASVQATSFVAFIAIDKNSLLQKYNQMI